MEKPFIIQFDFPLKGSNKVIPITATAELHHSDPYYKVHSIRSAAGKTPPSHFILPDQEIKKIGEKGKAVWVHKDSGMPTLLSEAMGRAIDEMEGENSKKS